VLAPRTLLLEPTLLTGLVEREFTELSTALGTAPPEESTNMSCIFRRTCRYVSQDIVRSSVSGNQPRSTL
jgi:hypothetical protein